MNQTKVDNLTDSSMKNLHELVDVNTIIGDPINVADGITIIPVSKVSFGFASGGTDFPNKKPNSTNELFGGGSGGGVTITPIAFLVISGGEVKILHIATSSNTADKMVNMVPDVIDKVSSLISKSTAEKKAKEEAAQTKADNK